MGWLLLLLGVGYILLQTSPSEPMSSKGPRSPGGGDGAGDGARKGSSSEPTGSEPSSGSTPTEPSGPSSTPSSPSASDAGAPETLVTPPASAAEKSGSKTIEASPSYGSFEGESSYTPTDWASEPSSPTSPTLSTSEEYRGSLTEEQPVVPVRSTPMLGWIKVGGRRPPRV